MPGWVFGRDELINSARQLTVGSTNSVLMAPLLGGKNQLSYNGNFVHGNDVADVHVWSLNPNTRGNQSFLLASDGLEGAKWEQMFGVAREAYPDAVADGRLKTDGEQPTHVIKMDSGKAEKTFDFKFRPFSQQVKDVAGQYLEVLAASA